MERSRVIAAVVGLSMCGMASAAGAQGTTSARRPQAKKEKGHVAPVVRQPALTPLTPRERVVQLLDRFTYGPRPGEVDRVLAMGADKWFEQQLNPAGIPDGVFSKRIGDLPTLNMTPEQALEVYPDRQQVKAVADGRMSMPADPLQRAVMEVEVARLDEKIEAKAGGDKKKAAAPAEDESVSQKEKDRATAMRIAGELLAMPKEQRMAALIAMPVADRMAFTGNGNVPQQQRSLLLADATPREREALLAMSGKANASYLIGEELAQGRVLRDILSERQVEAVMTDFWFNHFNVFVGKEADQWYTTSYERNDIRPNALGKFRDLLMATATSPAMMVYLDNWTSTGPDSIAGESGPMGGKAQKKGKGLNENYGREVMELHTVGVDGGYTQADVTSLAAILTGWTVDKPQQGGGFVFDPRRHEPGAKAWFGYCIAEDGSVSTLPKDSGLGRGCGLASGAATGQSMQQGVAAMKLLAGSPQTARFISTKLVQYFVADEPPPALVDRLTQVYLSSDGDIKAMLRAMVASPEFNSRQYFHNKVKTPVEFLASAYRATGTDPEKPAAVVNEAKDMGMPLYRALPPTGYYLTADQWMNSTALVDRLNFAYQLTSGKFQGQHFDAPKLLAVGMFAPGQEVRDAAAGVKPVGGPSGGAALRPISSATVEPVAVAGPGEIFATRLLEQTIVPAPVSAKTDALLEKQIAEQPASASATDTLNLVTGLLLGSPEFQMR